MDFRGKAAYIPRTASSTIKLVSMIVIGSVLLMSFAIYFVLQKNSEQDIRSALFEQQQQRQIQYSRLVSQNIASDLNSLMQTLRTIEVTGTIQNGDFTSHFADRLLQEAYNDSLAIAKVDGVFLVDANGKIVNYAGSSLKKPSFDGYDLSNLPAYVQYIDNNRAPTFSRAAVSAVDSNMRIILFYPIQNENTGEYLGAIAQPLVVQDFLSKYGNLDDVNQQYMNVLDSNGTFLSAPVKSSIGKNFFSQQLSAGSPAEATQLYKTVLSGKEDSALFSFRDFGSRLASGEPIIVGGKPTYFVFVITPTASMYSQIDPVIAGQRFETNLLLVGVAAAIGVAVFFLLRWSRTLEAAVKEQTADLYAANEQLKENDKLQRDFVNVAAHELRTPVQPLLALTGMLEDQLAGNDEILVTKHDIQMLSRNAQRLEKLSSDILEVAKLESQSVELQKEAVDINSSIQRAIDDETTRLLKSAKPVKISFQSTSEHILVNADGSKLSEVLSNLLNNAIKFTNEGTVKVTLEKDCDHGLAVVSVIDTGRGIDPEIYPRLFGKFATKSIEGGGTGLGLYISKRIVEAHGGSIWGENNKDRGATFTFTIPLAAQNKVSTLDEGNQQYLSDAESIHDGKSSEPDSSHLPPLRNRSQ